MPICADGVAGEFSVLSLKGPKLISFSQKYLGTSEILLYLE